MHYVPINSLLSNLTRDVQRICTSLYLGETFLFGIGSPVLFLYFMCKTSKSMSSIHHVLMQGKLSLEYLLFKTSSKCSAPLSLHAPPQYNAPSPPALSEKNKVQKCIDMGKVTHYCQEVIW